MTTQQPLDRFETELLAELRAIVAEAEAGASTAPRRPLWRRRPALTVGVAAAATATVFVATSGIGPGGRSSASAADVLLGAARHAESAPPADGVYWHVRSIDSVNEGSVKTLVEHQMWQRKDGAVWVATDAEPAYQLTGSSLTLCDKEVDYAALRALPTEARALRAALEDAVLHGDDGAVPADLQDQFVTGCTIGLLRMPVPNAVRGAAYRSLAALPGTENLGRTTDREGRTGTELVFWNGSITERIVVDADSGDLLQYDIDGEKGERRSTLLEAGWTDTIPR